MWSRGGRQLSRVLASPPRPHCSRRDSRSGDAAHARGQRPAPRKPARRRSGDSEVRIIGRVRRHPLVAGSSCTRGVRFPGAYPTGTNEFSCGERRHGSWGSHHALPTSSPQSGHFPEGPVFGGGWRPGRLGDAPVAWEFASANAYRCGVRTSSPSENVASGCPGFLTTHPNQKPPERLCPWGHSTGEEDGRWSGSSALQRLGSLLRRLLRWSGVSHHALPTRSPQSDYVPGGFWLGVEDDLRTLTPSLVEEVIFAWARGET